MTVPDAASTAEQGGAEPGLDGGTSGARSRIQGRRRWSALRIGSAAPWVIAMGATSIVVQTLWPTRMELASGGLASGVARVTDEHPLAISVVLFLVFLEIARYWWRWAGRLVPRGAPARNAAGGLPNAGGRASRTTSASLFRLAAKISTCLALALVVRETVVRTYRVVSPSMVPTLNVGDRLLVNRIAYGFRLPLGGRLLGARPPRRGDIIVFSDESAEGGARGPRANVTPTTAPVKPKALVKRVIGLPGDFVAFRDGAAFVNGWGVPACDAGPFVTSVGPLTVRGRLAVEFLEERAYLTIRTPLDEAIFPGYRVPPGQVFVVGDDRGMSSDSRAWNEGRGAGVPLGRIEGRVSRRAIATLSDGGPDLRHLLPPLNLEVRQPFVDLHQTEERIAACLTHRPKSTRPPPASSAVGTEGPRTLLNASYDVTRELYRDVNAAFIPLWKQRTGQDLKIDQAHAGSSKQARSVIDGLPADVVTMNQELDIDKISESGLLSPQWAERLPNRSVPFRSTILFLVRQGNPKQIKDWDDLVRPGVVPIIPNPKTSGNGRYSFLAAWAYALRRPGGSEATARDFVRKLFRAVPVLDTGGRGASTTFVQRGIGDVLLTFENEVQLAISEGKGEGRARLAAVLPSISIVADNPVAVVDKVASRKGNTAAAIAYLQFLFSEQGQEIGARHHFRPTSSVVLARHRDQFPAIPTVSVADLGGWTFLQSRHFADGGTFDQIYTSQ